MAVNVIEPTNEHCKQLAPRLRPHEIEEVTVNHPDKTIEEILLLCLEISSESYCIYDDELGCIALFGVTVVDDESGIPWMLSSQEFFTTYKRRFIKETPDYLDKLFGKRKHLYNYVSAKNKLSQRWLKHLGFTIHKDKRVKFKNVLFYPFDIKRI